MDEANAGNANQRQGVPAVVIASCTPAERATSSGTPESRRRRPQRSRHGRIFRSPVTGPELPRLNRRSAVIARAVASTAEYLRSVWPNELAEVSIETTGVPTWNGETGRMPRWHVDTAAHRIVIYYIPLERLDAEHCDDDDAFRALVEHCVLHAVAEYLGKDPWEVAPGRHSH